jgi:Tol biopolymer transport system component
MRRVLILLAGAVLALPAAQAAATTPPGRPGLIVVDRSASVSITSELWVMNADGTNARQLTSTPNPLEDHEPAFSANGRQVFFSRDNGTQSDIYVTASDGSGGLLNLTNTTVNESYPDASPDGKQIAFERGPATDIWLMNSNGTNPVNITNTPTATEFQTSFSPDGRTIAFNRCQSGVCNVWVMNVDGSSPRQVTADTAPNSSIIRPAFSRDGLRIAYNDECNGTCKVYAVNLDGSGAGALVQPTSGLETRPGFTADGSRIGFSRCAAGNCDIVTIPTGGGPATPITTTPAPISEQTPDFEAVQLCGKRVATIVGDDGPDKVKGTKRGDVIDANAGKNKVNSGGGNDTICAGKKARINCGGGKRDRVIGRFKKAKNCERGKGL